MRNFKQTNFVSMYRKRTGLSQGDLAYLLGCRSKCTVCRHEKAAQVPTLRMALRFQVIFGVPVSAVFPKLFQDVEREVQSRAKVLLRRLEKGATPELDQKLETLRLIVQKSDL
jgi:DNA-binding XRE family transcriptional regulator